MIKKRAFYFVFLVFLAPHFAFAFSNGSVSLGVGYYSQYFLGKTTRSATGSASLFGEASFPLLLKYDIELWGGFFLGNQFLFTPLARSSPGNSAKVSFMQLAFLFGQNVGSGFDGSMDWYVGPGLTVYEIKGSGGTTEMNNGTGTATFAFPGGSSSIKKLTVNIGTSYNILSSRFAADLMIENLLSSNKRNQSLMLSYSYTFGGGRF